MNTESTKRIFKNAVLTGLNSKVPDYDFSIRNNSKKANLETDLTLQKEVLALKIRVRAFNAL